MYVVNVDIGGAPCAPDNHLNSGDMQTPSSAGRPRQETVSYASVAGENEEPGLQTDQSTQSPR